MNSGADELAFASASRQAALMREKRLSPVELVTAYLERIERLDERLRAFITVCGESALVEARQASSPPPVRPSCAATCPPRTPRW